MIGPQLHRFLACRDCATLVPIALEGQDLNGTAREIAAAREEFLATHGSHALIELERTESESSSLGPLWDPMATLHIELTDGDRLYLVTASRASVDEGRIYTFQPYTLRRLASEVDIVDRDVRRGLDLEFFPHAVRPTKIDDFLTVLHAAIRDLSLEDIEIAFVDAEDPAVSIAPMPEQTFQQILAASAEIFDPWEIPRVERFLRENRQETGVLALRVRRTAVIVND